MIGYKSFKKIFGRKFWKAFQNLPLNTPSSYQEKEELLKLVYTEIKGKTYHPVKPEFYIAHNKGSGVARISPVFTIKDYIVYYYCVIRLEHKLARNRTENTFGGWSISGLNYRDAEEVEIQKKIENLFDPTVSMPSWSFSPTAWYIAYKDFNAKLYVSLKESSEGYVVELDIANFYDSINLDILKRKIGEVFDGKYRDELSLLFHFLNFWNKSINHYNPQTVGLPQDAMSDCSRILANFYLQEYDIYIKKICDEIGAKYFRYADDQAIIVKNRDQIEHVIYCASRKLLALGLAINQKKVVIRTVDEMIEYRSYKLFDILLQPGSNKDPDKSNNFIDEVTKIIVSDQREKIKARGLPLLNRALTCNWEKVAYSQRVKLFSWYLDDDFLKDARTYQFSAIHERLHDREKDDFVASLDRLSERLLHNGFHYEVMAFMKATNKNSSAIQKRIATLRKIYAN